MHSRYLVVVLSALSQYAHAFGSMPKSMPDPCDRCPRECQDESLDNLSYVCLLSDGCTACHGLCPARSACVIFYGDSDGGRARDASYCPDGFTFRRASHQANHVHDLKSDCIAFSPSDPASEAGCTARGGMMHAVFECP